MGFFDKVKKFVGVTGVKLDYTWIEDPFPFGDPMIKATIRVKAESEVTIVGKTGTFYARREAREGGKEEIVLGRENTTVDNCASTRRNGERVKVFPDKIEAGGESSYGFFVKKMDLAKSLAKWGIRNPQMARDNGVRFYFKGEIDVKETGLLFDPSLEQEIIVK